MEQYACNHAFLFDNSHTHTQCTITLHELFLLHLLHQCSMLSMKLLQLKKNVTPINQVSLLHITDCVCVVW